MIRASILALLLLVLPSLAVAESDRKCSPVYTVTATGRTPAAGFDMTGFTNGLTAQVDLTAGAVDAVVQGHMQGFTSWVTISDHIIADALLGLDAIAGDRGADLVSLNTTTCTACTFTLRFCGYR